jgi:uncharacterized repeat protein (TIGR01451 family)
VGKSPLHNTVFVEGRIPGCEGSTAACGSTDSDDANASVTPATPDIGTTAQSPVTIGQTITDTATVSGGYHPDGQVRFDLYGPSDSECGDDPVFTDTQTLSDNGDGTFSATSGAYTTTEVGDYHWVATYLGNDSDNSVAGECGDDGETSTVNPAQPQISTQASATVTLGHAIHDTAHVSGGYHPTGSVSFTVYGPNDANCSGTATSLGSATLDSNGDAVSANYTPTAPGTYRFVASYGGDENNLPVSGHCNDANESVAVVQPVIAIDKTGPARANQGDKVSYTLTVTNPGTDPIVGSTVVITDAQCNGAPVTLIGKGGDTSPDTLNPGDTWTYTCAVQTTVGQTSIHNVASVVGCDALGACANASDDADTILDAQIVEPTRIPAASARLLGPSGCVAKAFNARVRGVNVATVTFVLDGKVIKKVTNTKNAVQIVARINPAKLKLGVHRLVANVTYRADTQKKAQSFRLSFQRCGKKTAAPRFTG